MGIFMILVILMQRPKQEGLGAAFGGGMTNQMFGAHTTNVLEKLTFKLAIIFIVFCFARSILLAKQNQGVTLISEQPIATQSIATDTAQTTENELENIVEKIKTQLDEPAQEKQNEAEQVAQEVNGEADKVAEEVKGEVEQVVEEVKGEADKVDSLKATKTDLAS